jgi:hypothetical protein
MFYVNWQLLFLSSFFNIGDMFQLPIDIVFVLVFYFGCRGGQWGWGWDFLCPLLPNAKKGLKRNIHQTHD